MIYNILLLLTANIFIPFVPIPPELFLGYCRYEYGSHQVTVYDDMNLTRHYNEDQFKKAFRDSLKRLHPDRGGSPQNFAKVKGIKEIMQNRPNYYDLYNVTSVDLKIHQSYEQAAGMKQLLYQFQTVIFYFIALLYFIAFTIQEKLRRSRKILLPLTIIVCAYEFFIHLYPETETVFDLIDGNLPLFMQSILMKRIFCIITAIIRTRAIRKKDEQLSLLSDINKLPIIYQYQPNSESQIQNNETNQQNREKKVIYINTLRKLQKIYVEKVMKMQQNQKSWGTLIKNWISKGFSFLIMGLMIWGLVSSNMQSQKAFNPENQF